MLLGDGIDEKQTTNDSYDCRYIYQFVTGLWFIKGLILGFVHHRHAAACNGFGNGLVTGLGAYSAWGSREVLVYHRFREADGDLFFTARPA